MYKKISDYGVIGNLHSVALVGLDGSIDWLCLPWFDSPSIFAALLDEQKGGHFTICPTGDWDSVARYLKTTNILNTSFRTHTGVMVLTDFMPVVTGRGKKEESKHPELYRMVQITEGEMEVMVEYVPRFDYARAETSFEKQEHGILARGGNYSLSLCCSLGGLEIEGDRVVGRWRMKRGDFFWVYLHFEAEVCRRFDPKDGGRALRSTEAFWHNWLSTTETGYEMELGHFQPMVERSALVLKLLQFQPTGAIAAAATTSLPEEIGGVRNWDYRFSWVRDTALTLDALFNLGHMTETERYLSWIEKLIRERGGTLHVFYDLQGEPVGPEERLEHLEGYKGSRPVRIGNAAEHQLQLDIYGEIMDAALKLSKYIGKIDMEFWPLLQDICEKVLELWREKDHGIWEVRCGPFHFVHSKVLCWVALDRGITIAKRYGFPADLQRWERIREEIREEVMTKGWCEEKQAFVQHYDTDALDASILLLPFFGFLPYDHPRMVSTVEAIEKELKHDGFIYRYRTHKTTDGLPGAEGVFLICTFWYIDNLIGQGKIRDAEALLHRVEKGANHLGLFAEEFDVRWRTPLGNFPQALTHIGYIHSVLALVKARAKEEESQKDKINIPLRLREKLLVTSDFVLNEGDPQEEEEPGKVAVHLKHQMNLLQGAFFQTAEGRVAYEKMEHSHLYHDYVRASRRLQRMDLKLLGGREERIAFWINIYNVLVIHGVIELEIRKSVREIPRFFRRIRYRIGEMEFSADDIEHGILRGNRRYPNSLFHPFDSSDPRRSQMIEPLEPRIHFALVCASRSCPPIEVYEAKTLDEQLDISARTFLNTEGVRVDRDDKTVRLSQVFQWYGEDFGETSAERLRFVSQYLYSESDRNFVQKNAEDLKIRYIDYDWRLNRTEAPES